MQIDGETVEILTDFILGALRSLQMLTATMKLRHLLLGRKVINHLAAAAKALQSCRLCDPIDGSPPGSALPGILQARTLEWVAISFSNA